MTNKSYIVTLAVPTEEFRRTLAEVIPDATVLRELSRNRVVVLVPATSADFEAADVEFPAAPPPVLATTRGRGRRGDS